MDGLIYMLVNNNDNSDMCEKLIEDYYHYPQLYGEFKDKRIPSILSYFLSNVNPSLFRKMFHVNKETILSIIKEIKATGTFRVSPLKNFGEAELIDFVCVSVLHLNTCMSLNSCAKFCGISSGVAYNYINLFNKIMNELKDKVIRFPALSCQGLLKVNSKRFFPGAVGVVDTVFIPKLFNVNETCFSYSEEYHKQGIKMLLVVGRDGKFFNIHISENGGQSNCSIYNESALGYTLRYHKRSVLNRGSFLIADRSYPELPYLQIPFSSSEIQHSNHPATLSNYNYWHHKARFIAERSIQRWLYRSPKCRQGLPYSSSRSCIIFIISSLVLHQLCQLFEDEWTDDDDKIKCVVIASKDGRSYTKVDEECYKVYSSGNGINNAVENDYYDLKNVELIQKDNRGEVVNEPNVNIIYEKLKIVARKRRDFLVELVSSFPNRSTLLYDD